MRWPLITFFQCIITIFTVYVRASIDRISAQAFVANDFLTKFELVCVHSYMLYIMIKKSMTVC